MSRHITPTEDEMSQIRRDLDKHFNNRGIFNTVYTIPTFGLNTRTQVTITWLAWVKMKYLVDRFDGEVGWHGTATRSDNGYEIHDIVVYPQVATESNIVTDQDEYENWCLSIPEEMFSSVRFHGHSHGRIRAFPSATDCKHQEAIVADIGCDDFYIFCILNRQNECFMRVFDKARNMMFDTEDIDVVIQDDGLGFSKLFKDCEHVETAYIGKQNITTAANGKKARKGWI